MLVRPGRTWDAVADEPVDERELLARYAAPLAAIPAVCGALGSLVFGFRLAEVGLRQSPVAVLCKAVAGYALTLVCVWLLARFVALLAPRFGGTGDAGQAMKLAAYSGTAAWVGGVFDLYPPLSLSVSLLAGLWSLHALYLGLPKLTRSDPERTLVFYALVLAGVLSLAGLRVYLMGKAADLGGPLALA
jgi:hypothetical protein